MVFQNSIQTLFLSVYIGKISFIFLFYKSSFYKKSIYNLRKNSFLNSLLFLYNAKSINNNILLFCLIVKCACKRDIYITTIYWFTNLTIYGIPKKVAWKFYCNLYNRNRFLLLCKKNVSYKFSSKFFLKFYFQILFLNLFFEFCFKFCLLIFS